MNCINVINIAEVLIKLISTQPSRRPERTLSVIAFVEETRATLNM
jgi:hypothetical protein